ncbi:MAG: cytochrome c biogenesis protein CcdA, partial [Oliverpabstia sp.]
YNIIEDNCLELLKGMFREYEVEESEQVVPAIFVGDMALTSQARICSMDTEKVLSQSGNDCNRQLVQQMKNVQEQVKQEEGQEKNSVNLLTLAGAGLLAGLNPCSISMLLMLLSLILSEKASVWKNGLLYLLGKYGAYFAIGLGIYFTASQIPEKTLGHVGRVIDIVLVVLFVTAGVLYLTDAMRVFHQDYGHIRTQLPVRLRRLNHRMIRRASGKSGIFQPLLILGLGVAISLGEFFCTGQIYMATITYLLKDHISGVWLAFLVYVTAMSLPAFCMILLIQRTRNTEHVSDFMLRHMGAIKILNAVLFFGFAIYFLIR